MAATPEIRRRLLALTAVALLGLGAPKFAVAADLAITISDLRSTEGDVHIALYDDPQRFPDSDGMIDELRLSITTSSVTATFTGLAPGRYAIAAYHDENANHEFDQGLFAIPLENYAFSNGATVFFAAPSFDEAAFTVAIEGSRQTVSMGN